MKNSKIKALIKYHTERNPKITAKELDIILQDIDLDLELDPVKATDVILSETVNKNFDDMFVDINTIFNYLDATDSKKDKVIRSNLSRMNGSISELYKLNGTLDKYENFMISKGNPSYIVEDFKTAACYEADISFYSERYGERAHEFSTGTYEPSARELRLPKTLDINMATYSEGIVAANVSLENLYGAAYRDIKKIDSINNILNETNTNSWEESILAPSPIHIETVENDFVVNQGVLCKLKVEFETATVINELIISPSSKYPVDILDISYKTTDSPNEKLENISKVKHTEPLSLGEPVIYRFPSILLKQLYITINQAHYLREPILIKDSEELIESYLYSRKAGKLEPKIFDPFYNDLNDQGAVFNLIDNALANASSVPVTELFFLKKDDGKVGIRYIYELGLNYIAPKNIMFDTAGFYVSNEIDHITDIDNVSIETIEEHQETEKGIITDVEYYITHHNKPSWKDWKPILPKNKTKIHRERLQMYGDTCYLRFPAESVDFVKIEDADLVENFDYQLRTNDEGKVIGVVIPSFDHVSMYTCSYIPVRSNAVSFNDSGVLYNSETFISKGESVFELENLVYAIDKNSVRVVVSDPDNGNIYSDVSGLECVTSEDNPAGSYNNFKPNGAYQFYSYSNYVCFNKLIPKGYKVDITYPHKVNKFRLKAILRRNDVKFKHITPTVKQIKYRITGR